MARLARDQRLSSLLEGLLFLAVLIATGRLLLRRWAAFVVAFNVTNCCTSASLLAPRVLIVSVTDGSSPDCLVFLSKLKDDIKSVIEFITDFKDGSVILPSAVGKCRQELLLWTKTIPDNGFNPFWDESFQFHVSRPSLALLRFAVYDSDMFGESCLIAQATYPLACIRQGFRSVPLKNGFSELLEMSSLLILLDHQKRKKDSFSMTSSTVMLQKYRADRLRELQTQISEAESRDDEEVVQLARAEFKEIESQMVEEFHRMAYY